MARFLDLDLIVERIAEEVDSGLYRYLSRIDSGEQATKARSGGSPGILVVGLRTTTGAQDGWRIERFGIVVDVRDVAAHPESGRDALLALREAVDEVLIGWRPSADFTAVEYGGGRLLGVGDGWYRHLDEYTTEFGVRAPC